MKLVRNVTDASLTSSRFIKEMQPRLNGADTMWKMITLEMINRLPELLLMRVDKMSMGASIETRVPFLDLDLVEFALTIPSSLKQKNGHNKYILKKAAEGIIPDEIIYRKKWGFCGSATNLLTEKVYEYAKGKILDSQITDHIFNRDFILSVFNNYKKQKRFNSFKIWNLLNLVLWYEHWL
jgi:asparagine synthase (glutamine-hydrolysing)